MKFPLMCLLTPLTVKRIACLSHAPKIKTKPGKLKKKRRMDVDEKSNFGTKKLKVDPKLLSNTTDGVHLKRQLGTFTCSFCGEKGHTKRGCKKKRDADAAAAAEAAEKKKKDEGNPTPDQQVEQPQNDGGQHDVESNHVEIEISQPIASEEEDSQKDPGLKRPSKLSPRRRSSLSGTSPTVNPLQSASSTTATKFANVMKFIPTPGFKPPRKKN
ncbi:uncharacterized protein [Arachis hypogaea]|uniref:CCHC-type domain-containing protein n=1 Tax=Arachis hypogaea TaxID=3818 RepID=A0A445ATI6_ARAHY|nr:hypothetical protein Ahy_B01g054226 [Arachis hypogaea]